MLRAQIKSPLIDTLNLFLLGLIVKLESEYLLAVFSKVAKNVPLL
jgi:hypothetical protein